MSATLNDRLVWRGVPTEEYRNAEQAFVSCHRDLRRRSIGHDVDKRDDAGDGEIEVWQLAPRGVNDLAERHWNKLQLRQQSFVDCLGQGREQMILLRSRWRWHYERPI